MCKRIITISNAQCLRGQSAIEFVQKSNSYKPSIWIKEGQRKVNAKSLLGVLSLVAENGMSIQILSEGNEGQKAVDELATLIT